MDVIQVCRIRRHRGGEAVAADDAVVAEARVEIDINDGKARFALLCLPRELEPLAAGFLLGEGVLRRREDLRSVEAVEEEGIVRVRGDFDADAMELLSSRWTWGSGCGGGGTSRDLDRPPFAPVGEGPTVSPEQLARLEEAFLSRQELWRQTGGVHACALASPDGIVLCCEDVGRHNAFDKVMGRALLEGVERSDKLVLTTGRLSAEIVSKAVACGVPVVASRSAPTALAVRVGRRFGLTLVGFLRGRRFNVYAGFQRIAGGEAPP